MRVCLEFIPGVYAPAENLGGCSTILEVHVPSEFVPSNQGDIPNQIIRPVTNYLQKYTIGPKIRGCMYRRNCISDVKNTRSKYQYREPIVYVESIAEIEAPQKEPT